jgi:pimeloyl-ACP methyl ester carboxylesterase
MTFRLVKNLLGVLLAVTLAAAARAEAPPAVEYKTADIGGLKIFYREAGPPTAPVLLLLHGFPTSSHMYRELIPKLADRFRVIAPDYPGFGHSDAPPQAQFGYTFDKLTDTIEQLTDKLALRRYTLYMQDYGGPVGFRLATRHPERVQALVIQNAVAHAEGLSNALDPAKVFWHNRTPETEQPIRGLLAAETTKFQYLQGAKNASRVSPDAWAFDQALLDRPGNADIQLALLYDYRTNPPLYAQWQAYLRQHQPKTLVVWGKNDPFFTVAGANAYKRDVPKAEVHLLDAGHFALEEHADAIARRIKAFVRAR